MWLRFNSYSEKCLSILGSDDAYFSFNSIDNILKLRENILFNKIITWAKKIPNQ